MCCIYCFGLLSGSDRQGIDLHCQWLTELGWIDWQNLSANQRKSSNLFITNHQRGNHIAPPRSLFLWVKEPSTQLRGILLQPGSLWLDVDLASGAPLTVEVIADAKHGNINQLENVFPPPTHPLVCFGHTDFRKHSFPYSPYFNTHTHTHSCNHTQTNTHLQYI